MVFEPRFSMGPPLRSFAADAHDCIMVQVDDRTDRIQVCGAMFAPDGELPSDRQPGKRCSGLRAAEVDPLNCVT